MHPLKMTIFLGAGGILSQHNNSLRDTLQKLYPEQEWLPWKLDTPFWGDEKVQKQFVEWLGKELGIQKMDDWYNVNVADVIKKGGRGLLSHYGGSLSALLMSVYRSHTWEIFRFSQVPKNFWDKEENQKAFMKWMEKEFNITDLDGWYNVSTADAIKKGAGEIINRHGGSLVSALQKLYSEKKWDVSKFKDVPRQYWNTNSSLDQYLDFVRQRLKIARPEDWYKVSIDDIKNIGGFDLLLQNGGLLKVLQKQYPQQTWSADKFANQGSVAVENELRSQLQKLFANKGKNCIYET